MIIRDLSLAHQLIETRLRSEQAKLALLEAAVPDEKAKKYTRSVDMPPPAPEDKPEEGPRVGQTVQDCLKARGATISDLQE